MYGGWVFVCVCVWGGGVHMYSVCVCMCEREERKRLFEALFCNLSQFILLLYNFKGIQWQLTSLIFIFSRLWRWMELEGREKKEKQTQEGGSCKTVYWINTTCSFQRGCWTHAKCRFTLHKTIYSLQHQKSVKHSRAFQSPVSCIKLLTASFLFAYVRCLMHTTTVSFVGQECLSKFSLRLCFRSTVCLSIPAITFIPVRHKGREKA